MIIHVPYMCGSFSLRLMSMVHYTSKYKKSVAIIKQASKNYQEVFKI